MSLKGNLIIGCAFLAVVTAGFWISEKEAPTPAPAAIPSAVTDTSPRVVYTFEQQQASFKLWLKDFDVKTNEVNGYWKELAVLLEDPEQDGIYDKLEAIQLRLEKFQGTYSAVQPLKELTEEQQSVLKIVNHNMDEGIESRIKFIRLTKAYYLRQRYILQRQSNDQKELVELYQATAIAEVNKLKETFKVE